jgi:hypothetical protein
MNKEALIQAIDTVGVDEVAKNLKTNGWIVKQIDETLNGYEGKAAVIEAFMQHKSPEVIKVNKTQKAVGCWLFRKLKQGYILAGLYRNGVLEELHRMGFYKRIDKKRNIIFVRDTMSVLDEVAPKDIKIAFYENYIKKIKEHLHFDGLSFTPEDLHEKYLAQFHLVFNENWLQHLPTHKKKVLRDTKNEVFFPFENGVVKVSKKGHHLMSYEELNNQCVWRKHIVTRPFNYTHSYDGSHFFRFMANVANHENDRVIALMTGMGYLLHSFNRATGGQVVMLYDETPSGKGKPEGGTGKGLFVNAAKQMRETTKIDGKKYKGDSVFKWQSVTPSTQIVWIDDVHDKFPFSDLHSNSTDGWNIEPKRKPEFYLSPSESPKTVITSNTILTTEGSTNKRRQFVLEFSNHYSKHILKGNEEPIKEEHGCTFFDDDDWPQSEWDMFYSFMITCSHRYLRDGLQVYEHRNLARNQVLQATNEDFAEWVFSRDWQLDTPYSPNKLFNEYKTEYLAEDDPFKQQTFTKWLRFFGSCKNWEVERKKSGNERPLLFIKKGG